MYRILLETILRLPSDQTYYNLLKTERKALRISHTLLFRVEFFNNYA